MKFGILTFHDVINYGAVLQAQALCNTLNQITSNNCEIIDYKCDALEEMYRVKGNSIVCMLKRVYLLFKRRKFQRYLAKNSVKSHRVDKSDIQLIGNKYAGIIVGSDQVWNGNVTNNDENFFLPFASDSCIKASYAASLGDFNISEQDRSVYLKLKTFKGISVREKKGKEKIDKVLGDSLCEVHLDPTLLKDAAYWEQFAKKPRRKKYIFVYAAGHSTKIIKVAEKIRCTTNADILYMGGIEIPNGIKVRSAGPGEWLGLIKYADAILTTSFHATAFSIIFNKRFFADISTLEGKVNERIDNILTSLGLNNQIIENALNYYDAEIDWSDVKIRLDTKKSEAMDYLQSVVKKGD